jgi:hypothetical protein
MAISQPALDILTEIASLKVAEFPASKQISIYLALAEVLPDQVGRDTALELAKALSRVDALQLEFMKIVGGLR